MSESVVRVDLRHATLSESARLREGEEGTFLVLDAPPPVRSLLRLIEGESTRAFEVARVIEVIDEQQTERGCYGSFVDDERLDAQDKVGSEHLSPGISNSGAPAPVVIMNTGEMELGEVGEEGEAAAEAHANAQADADAQASDAEDSDADSNAEGAESSDSDTQDTHSSDSDTESSDSDTESSDSDTESSDSDAESSDSDTNAD